MQLRQFPQFSTIFTQPHDVPLDLDVKDRKVAGRQKVAQALVLRRHDGRIALVADLVSEHDEDMAGKRVPQGLDDAVSRGAANLTMELEVGPADLDPFEAFRGTR